MSKSSSKFCIQIDLSPTSGIRASFKIVEMPKKGGSSGSDSNTIQELVPRIEAVPSSIFALTSTNYHLWAMRMEVYLEAHGLWDSITGTETNRKKDRQALSAILNSVSESVSFQFDVRKSAKDNWETIKILHVGVDHVVQSKIQSLRREFENLAMKKDQKVSDFLITCIYNLNSYLN